MILEYKKVKLAPFCTAVPSVNDTLSISLFLLIPQLFCLFFAHSYRAIVIICVSTLAVFLSNLIYSLLQHKQKYFNWSTFLQGFLIGFLLPDTFPVLLVLFIVFFTNIILLYTFGSFGQSWINPISITLVVAYAFGYEYYSLFLLSAESFTSPNTGLQLFSQGILDIHSLDISVTNWLNNVIFRHLGISVPEGYITLLIDNKATIPAFRFNGLTLLSSMFLISVKSLSGLVPLIALLVYAILVRVLGLYPFAGILLQGDILLALLTSGTLFVTFFILQWFGTQPTTRWGKILLGIEVGGLYFLLSGSGTSSVGAIFTVLIANISSTSIQKMEDNLYLKKVKRSYQNQANQEITHG